MTIEEKYEEKYCEKCNRRREECWSCPTNRVKEASVVASKEQKVEDTMKACDTFCELCNLHIILTNGKNCDLKGRHNCQHLNMFKKKMEE